jgi:hypothetical protein
MITLYFLITMLIIASAFKIADLVEYYTNNRLLAGIVFILVLALPVTLFLDLTV